MELIDRYLQAVRFWLPKSQQQDIVAELSEDLRSQVEEKETELGRPLNDAEVGTILKRCGSPMLVASRYRPRTFLIGPGLFPIYQAVLKMTLLWMIIPLYIAIIGPAMILPSANRWEALLRTWSALWTALFLAAAIITIVFALLERGQTKLHLTDKWEPSSLPPLAKDTPKGRVHSVFELIFSALGLLWILSVPHYPFLIFGPAAAFLKPSPIWQSFYLPIVLLAIAGLLRPCVSLLRPRWTWFSPWSRVVNTALSLIVLYFILAPAFKTSSGVWQPYVVSSLTEGPQHATRLAAIVNLSVLVSLASVWLGLSIAAVVQTWEAMRHVRGTPNPASPTLFRFLWR